MRLYLNDLTDLPKKCDELGETIVCMSGYDRPKYVDPRRQVAGDLGFDTWIEPWNKATFNANTGATTLTAGKYYSIVVVPVDLDTVEFDDFQRGTPNLPSMPRVSAVGGLGIRWNIPSFPQQTIYDVGSDDTGTANEINDATKAWTVDQWIGYTVLNVETGESDTVISNTATAIVLASLAVTSGDRYQITKDKCTQRDIYAIEMDNAYNLSGATFIYQGRIKDNTTTTYDLNLYVTSGESAPTSNIPPDNYSYCEVADNRVFAIGGITDTRGKASIENTPETYQASVGLPAVVTVETDFFSGAGSGRVMRYSLQSLGPQLVINGTFDANITDWSTARPAVGTISWSGITEALRCTSSVTTGEYGAVTSAPIALEIGNTYLVSGLIESDTQPSAVDIIISANSDLTGGTVVASLLNGLFSVSFVATSASVYFGAIATSTVVGQVFRIDDFSIKEDAQLTNLYTGSFVTISGSDDPLNDIEDARVIRKADDNTWLEIINETGVADASEESALITLYPSVLIGSAVPADVTYFSEGMLFGTFQFAGERAYSIAWVDPINQLMTFSEKYEGNVSVDTAFTIETSYDLSWSDYGNPHVWRSENSTQIADKGLSIAIFRGLILVFCRRSLWKIPLSNLYQTPSLVTDNIQFSAPFSVVSTPNGIMFYDGTGFSITDGQAVRSISQYKATDFLRQINTAMAHNISGAYDSVNRRVEYVFPLGTDITNNAGMYITIDSLNIYPFTRMDCNVIWEDEDADGRPIIKHGTSGRHVLSGSGTVWEHPLEQPTDGEFGASATFGTITAVNADHLVISTTSALTLGEGTIALHYPDADGGALVQFIVKDVVEVVAGSQYEVYFSEDWYSDGFELNGALYFTMIPFIYGIKWLDFSSPQYQHKVRQVQIDVTNLTGSLFVEHYGDLSESPIQIDNFIVSAGQTKLIIPLKKGSYYTYGFRLRGYSSTQANILSFEILFDTEV